MMEECRDCKLWETAKYQVEGDGPKPCDWMVVGEAPGFEEDKSGVPFVGAAGRELGRLLEMVGLSRGQVYVTNVVKHRPPGNRKPTVSEVKLCLRHLWAEMADVRPKYTILLGATPLSVFFPKDSISAVHGRVRRVGAAYFIPMFHPAAMLHNPQLRGEIEADWKTLRERIASYGRENREYKVMVADSVVADVVALDTETDWNRVVVGASVSSVRGAATFVPCVGDSVPLTVDANTLVFHNAKFDLRVLRGKADIRAGRIADTMIAAYLLAEPALGLKSLALKLLGEDMDYLGPLVEEAQIRLMGNWLQKADTVILEKKWQKSYIKAKSAANTTDSFHRRKKLLERLEKEVGPLPHASARDVPLDKLAPYACADADMTRRLWFKLSDGLDKWGLRELYWGVEMPLLPILMRMEDRGIAVDDKVLETVQGNMVRLSEESLAKCKSFGDFNPGSPQATLAALHNMGIRVRDTNKDTLTPFKKEYPIIAALLDAREKKKLLGYVGELRGDICEGRIHTSFNQVRARDDDDAEGATVTGRISSSDPNLQNIPIRTELGREIRKAFVPSPGMMLVSVDYSQIEPRILAHISEDEGLMYAFRNKHDPYQFVGSLIYKVEEKEIVDGKRDKSKTVLLGTNYGLTEHGLSQRLAVSVDEARWLIDTYLGAFPGIRRYMDARVDDARRRGYVSTLWGRREYLPEILSNDDTRVERARRMALNMPIQGTAADIMKAAIVAADARLKALRNSHLLLTIHDEIIAETDNVEECVQVVAEAMLDVIRLKVPLVVHSRWGRSWGELGNQKEWSQ